MNKQIIENGGERWLGNDDANLDHVCRYKFASESISPADDVIEIACGTGYGTKYLSYNTYIGYDLSQDAIDYARKTYEDKNTFFIQQNLVTNFPETRRKKVLMFEFVEHIERKEFEEILEKLKDADTIFCSTPLSNNGWTVHSPYHKYEYNPLTFITMFTRLGYKVDIYFNTLDGKIYKDLESANNYVAILIKAKR
jgi:SAM-dependent methyltransferase